AQYVSRFRTVKPRLVQTVSARYSPYEPWIECTSWDFYEDLLAHYVVVATSPWSVFWERQPNVSAKSTFLGIGTPIAGTQSMRLPRVPASGDAPSTLWKVELHYRVRNALHRLPILGSLPRFLVSLRDAVNRLPVPLDPYVTSERFPLLA